MSRVRETFPFKEDHLPHREHRSQAGRRMHKFDLSADYKHKWERVKDEEDEEIEEIISGLNSPHQPLDPA